MSDYYTAYNHGNYSDGQRYGKTVDAASEPVTAAEAKSQLIIDGGFTADDALLDSYIKAARLTAERYCSISFVESTYVERVDYFPMNGELIKLSVGQVSEVVSITYIDTDGNSQTWDAANYKLDNTGRQARVARAYNVSYPTTRDEINAVTITYKSGFGSSASDVPQDIKQAILLIVAEMYQNREDRVKQLPTASQYLLQGYMVNSL